MKYVIIGNSAAAVGCIEGIRQVDKTGEIVVISKEKYHTYSRPLISYLLYGKTDLQRMKYRPDDFYEKMGCALLLGRTVTAINAKTKKVQLEDGTKIGYDKLMVATGSNPFVPGMKGLEDVEKRFTFMSLDDALALQEALTSDSRVLIVGAGLIGLKCAEGIEHSVRSITVVDLADRILPSILDEEGSAMVQEYIEGKGVKFYLNDSVAEFTKDKAFLKSGAEVDFDIVVIAVGVRPNTKMLSDAGAEVQRGVLVDEHCATTLPDIYSAGDCTQGIDSVTGESRVLALLPNAYMQGETAGVCMAGGEKAFDNAIAMNAIGFFGLHIITAGIYQGEEYVVRGENEYKKLVYADDRLKGYILIGKVDRAGIYTAMIREKTPLSSLDFELIKDKPQLMAFSHKERAKILGGAAQ